MSSPSSPSKGAAQPAPQATATTPTTTTTTTTTATPAKTNEEKPKPEKKKVPTKAQGEQWTASITALLADPEGTEAFRSYLEYLENERDAPGEYTKYIDFYIECEEYKNQFKKLEDKAKKICETYLIDDAAKEVSAAGKTEIVDKLEDEGLEGVTLFDDAQNKAKKKMQDNWYIDFCLDIKNKLKL